MPEDRPSGVHRTKRNPRERRREVIEELYQAAKAVLQADHVAVRALGNGSIWHRLEIALSEYDRKGRVA